jgi:hypothetical protein
VKLPCVCPAGFHTFNAHEMVDIIGAFQRGELQTILRKDGEIIGVKPMCLAETDFNARKAPMATRGKCSVLLPDNSLCQLDRGHHEGRHSSNSWPGKGK